MLELGKVVTTLGYRVDDGQADRYRRDVRGLRADARRPIRAEAKMDVDRRGFRTFDREADQAERRSGRLKGAIGGMGRGAAIAGAAMAGGLALGARKAWQEFEEAAKVGAQTDAVIKSTGGAAKVTAGEVSNLAASLSAKAGVDDEAIQSGSNLLLTFKNIRNEAGAGNDVFNQTTAAALDMSVAMKTDMRSAAMQLGKALNDPEKGVTKLMRAGVDFTDQQKEQIKTLQESGDVLGAQKIMLAEVNAQFGGSAEAQARPLDRAKVAVNNLFEAVGVKLAPAVEGAATVLADFVEGLTTGEGAGGAAADTFHRLAFGAREVIDWVGGAVDTVQEFFSGGSSAAGDANSAFADMKQLLGDLWGYAKGVGGELASAFAGVEDDLAPIGAAILKVGKVLIDFWGTVFRRIIPGARAVFGGLANMIRGVVQVISGIVQGDFGKVWGGVKRIIGGAVRAIGGAIRVLTAPFREVFARIGSVVGRGIRRVVGFFADLPGGIWRSLRRVVSRVGSWAAEIAGDASSAGRRFVRNVLRFLTGLPGSMWGVLKRAASRVANFARDVAGKAGDAGRAIVRNVVKFVTGLPGELWGALKRGITRLGQFEREAASKAVSAGKSVVEGVVRGLGQLGGAILSAGKRLASKVIGAVKDALGISSPSKEFMAVGREIVNGLIAGMNFDAAKDFIGKALGGIKSLAWKLIKEGAVKIPIKLIPRIAKFLGVGAKDLALAAGHSAKDLAKSLGKKAGDVAGDVGGFLGLATGGRSRVGRVGPGAGGPVIEVRGEGARDEWVISQEGDRRANIGYALDALQALGVTVNASRKGKGRKSPPAPKANVNKGVFRSVARGTKGVAKYEREIQDLERDYGQWDRRFALSTEEFVIEDADGVSRVNTAAVNKRIGEIDALIRLRNAIKAKIQAYLNAVRALIANLQTAIRKLNKALAAATGKARAKERGQYRALITKYGEQIGELSQVAGDLPFDVTDAQIDLEELYAERSTVASTSVSGGGGGGGGGQAGATPEQIAEAAAAQVAAFNQSRASLLGAFGANFVQSGRAAAGDESGLAAGRRYFGAFDGAQTGEGAGAAAKALTVNQTFNFGRGPSDSLTFSHGVANNMKTALR